MRLAPYPKLGRYKGKGRPDAALFPRGVPTLPPLPSLAEPTATINPNGDSPACIITRCRIQQAQLAADATISSAERRCLLELLGRIITAMENRP